MIFSKEAFLTFHSIRIALRPMILTCSASSDIKKVGVSRVDVVPARVNQGYLARRIYLYLAMGCLVIGWEVGGVASIHISSTLRSALLNHTDR